MILTDYYKLQRLSQFANNKTPRFDCVGSTQSYELFEQIADSSKVKRFFCYYSPNGDGAITANRKRMADMRIFNRGNISSVYVPDLEFNHIAFGDVKNTNDALTFIFSDEGNTMELFIARGYKNNNYAIYDQVKEGELDHELNCLRANAIPIIMRKDELD